MMNSTRTFPKFQRALLVSATAVLGAATALPFAASAQMNPGTGSMQQSTPAQSPQIQTQPGQADASSPTPGMTTANGASLADQAFVSEIFESDKAEVALGQLAAQKSQSQDVKQLGQRMADNRMKLDQQLKPLADKMDVKMPSKPGKKEREEIAKLETLSGPAFDQEYLKDVARDNEKDVKDFEAEETAATDPNLLQAAKADAPVLAQHQKAVEKIAQTHNVELSEK
jgi:putative membrane protein